MIKKCRKCGADFSVSDGLKSFLDKRSIPYPSICFECRMTRRESFRNERHFYPHKCHLCKKPIVTIYPPGSPYKILCYDCFWGDKWDPCEGGRDYDFKRPFFEQFSDLIKDSYLLYLFNSRLVNSEFVNQETDDKNCYYNAGGHYNEDCYYNTYAIWSKDTVDGYWNIRCELCYECNQCERCFNCDFCQDCEACIDCDFCRECISCQNCFGCIGLRHKQYCVLNEEYSKDRYERFLKNYKNLYVADEAKQNEIQAHYEKYPQPFAHHKKTENCTGDYLINCKNTHNAFIGENTWDCENFFLGLDIKNSYDLTSFAWGELLYEVASSIELYDCQFCTSTINVKFSQYCFVCQNSDHLFGCAGVRNKKYCIFNKQYSEGEYKKLVPRIIEHMKQTREYGEFFPSEISPFLYTDTVANDYYPLKS